MSGSALPSTSAAPSSTDGRPAEAGARSASSTPLEVRLALLQEGLDPFAEVLRLARDVLRVGFELELVRQVVRAARVESGLDQAVGPGGHLREPGGEGLRLGGELFVRIDLPYHAHLASFLRGDLVRQQGERPRAGIADQPGQEPGAAGIG